MCPLSRALDMFPEHDIPDDWTAISTPLQGRVLCFPEVLIAADPNRLTPRIRQMLNNNLFRHYLVVHVSETEDYTFVGEIRPSSDGSIGQLPVSPTITLDLVRPMNHQQWVQLRGKQQFNIRIERSFCMRSDGVDARQVFQDLVLGRNVSAFIGKEDFSKEGDWQGPQGFHLYSAISGV